MICVDLEVMHVLHRVLVILVQSYNRWPKEIAYFQVLAQKRKIIQAHKIKFSAAKI